MNNFQIKQSDNKIIKQADMNKIRPGSIISFKFIKDKFVFPDDSVVFEAELVEVRDSKVTVGWEHKIAFQKNWLLRLVNDKQVEQYKDELRHVGRFVNHKDPNYILVSVESKGRNKKHIKSIRAVDVV